MAVSGTYILQLNSGTSPGPYTIYADTLDSNPIEMNVSATRLRDSIVCTVTPQPTKFIVVNNNPACNNRYIVSVNAPAPPATPTPTSTPNPSPTMTPTLTGTPTQTPTPSPTNTPTPTIAPTLTPTLTATSSPAALVPVRVNLTIDAGNTGYTQIFYPLVNGGPLELRQTLTTTSTTTFNVPSGNRFYVITLQQSRAYTYQLSEIIYSVNSIPDVNSPYLAGLNVPNVLSSIPVYGGSGYPTVTFGNTYVVDTYIGNQR